jgi:hypothetical protein
MKSPIRTFAATLGVIIALAVTFAGAAAAPRIAEFAGQSRPAAALDQAVSAPAAACGGMEAGDVVWVTLDEEGNVDEEVESYPSETTKVTAAFEYNCVPKKITLVTVWSIDGETVLTDKTKPKASDKSDTWTASLFMKDESALPDGEYGVEFFVNDESITSGTVIVGESQQDNGGDNGNDNGDDNQGGSVTVQGVVQNSKTKKPIKGAVVVVLNEDVEAEAWLEEGTDEDVFASAKTDSKGQFELSSPIELGVAHDWLVGAEGYKPIIEQDMVLEEGTEDPLSVTINLVKK